MKKIIPFNNAHFSKVIPKKINKLLNAEFIQTAAGFEYFKKCNELIEKKLNVNKCYITNSCTAALEAAAILIDLKKGDEVILPSYTFVSTANAIFKNTIVYDLIANAISNIPIVSYVIANAVSTIPIVYYFIANAISKIPIVYYVIAHATSKIPKV